MDREINNDLRKQQKVNMEHEMKIKLNGEQMKNNIIIKTIAQQSSMPQIIQTNVKIGLKTWQIT